MILAWRHALVALLLAAFSVPAAAATPTLRLGLPVEPTGLDPTIAAPIAIREVTWGNIFEGLVTLDKDGKVVPQLAAAWTISADGLVYTFKLRPGVLFHNGVPFDSSIVRFALDRARAPQSTNAQKQFFEPIASVATPDPLTAVVTLKHPAGLFLYWLAWGDAAMVEPGTAATNKIAPNGTGPFVFKEWRRGESVEVVRNLRYWQPGVPTLDRVLFRFIGDVPAQAAALRAGDIDAFPNFGAPELVVEFDKDPRYRVVVGVTPRKLVAGLNCAKPPLDDRRVRQALMHAIDRKAVIEGAFSGFGTPIGSHFAPSDRGYVDLTDVLPYDPAKAKALLAEAGYGGGLSLTMKVPQMTETTRSAEIIQAFLADVGVTLTLEPSEFPAKWIEDVFLRKNYEATIIDHAEPMDIDIYARPGYYFDYKNPALDDLVRRAEGTADAAEREKFYGEAARILAADVPALYLLDLPRIGIWSRRLDGFWPNEPIAQTIVRDVRWLP